MKTKNHKSSRGEAHYRAQAMRTERNKRNQAAKRAHDRAMWADTWAFVKEMQPGCMTNVQVVHVAKQQRRKTRNKMWNTPHSKAEVEGSTLVASPRTLAEFVQVGGTLRGGAAVA